VSVGVPEIFGAAFGGLTTAIENGASALLARPSLTLIEMLAYVPTAVVGGVPYRRPVEPTNVAHAGTFCAVNVSASPSVSLADGWNA
jgi:hypothetical protein